MPRKSPPCASASSFIMPKKEKAAKKVLYTLVNVEDMNQKHPETFEILSRKERESVLIGDFVKCIFQGKEGSERMWVIVQKDLGALRYEGELDNDPVFINAKCGDKVIFSPEHIAQIMEGKR